MVGVTGFEPAASTSQTSRATNCATPRYAIKLWSCKWSNMWSGTNLTAFLIFTNCPKSAPLKGFRRFFFSGTEWEIYAPKPRALPTALHPDSQHIYYTTPTEKCQEFSIAMSENVQKTAPKRFFALVLSSFSCCTVQKSDNCRLHLFCAQSR